MIIVAEVQYEYGLRIEFIKLMYVDTPFRVATPTVTINRNYLAHLYTHAPTYNEPDALEMSTVRKETAINTWAQYETSAGIPAAAIAS